MPKAVRVFGALVMLYASLQAGTSMSEPAIKQSSEPELLVDGSWRFLKGEKLCSLSINYPSIYRPAVLVQADENENLTLLTIVGIDAEDNQGRPTYVFLDVDGGIAISKDKGPIKVKGEPGYAWSFSIDFAERLTKARSLKIQFGAQGTTTLNLKGGDGARSAMLECLKPQTSQPVTIPEPPARTPERKADRRFCKFGYCPCDRTDPDYGGVDSQICRTRAAGMPVSDEWMIIGANGRDARRQLREFNGQ